MICRDELKKRVHPAWRGGVKDKFFMERFKKIFVGGVIFVTVLSMSVVAAPQAGATASAGDLIKMAGLSSVYYFAADGKRYVFPNETTYFSWYKDFSGVMTIPQAELESYPLGANVTVRPGTKLVKITTNPKVYAVTSGGTLLAIPDEHTASELFGANWNKRIVDVPDAFFTNYKIGSATVKDDAYPQGSLVKFGASADVYYINADGTASKFTTEAAFTANRFKFADVITAPASIVKPTSGADITGAVSTLIDTSSGAGGVANAGTGLTVALASDTPASATVITDVTTTTGNGQASVPFLKVNFTAAADGDVKVTNLKFKRAGISADTDLDNLYLYDGDTRLTDGSGISSTYTTFNNASGLFTVAKGTTKTITLKGDMNYAATSGKTIGFTLVAAADVVTNGAAVSGSFPMAGNLMSTANATDLGKLTITNPIAGQPSGTDVSITPANDQEILRFVANSTNQELSILKLRLTAVGSIQLGDIKNFKLYSAGSQVGPTVAAMDTGNVVSFDFSAAPLIVLKGSSKTLSLRADIVDGSTRTFYFSFQNQQDIVVKDNSYNVLVEPYLAGTFSVIKPAGNYLVAAGDLSIAKSVGSPTADVAVDATNVTLASYDFTATGEDMKVKDIDVTALTTRAGSNISNGILNGKIYADNVQVGSTKNLTGNSNVDFTFGSTFIVKAGTTAKVKIIGDIKSTTSTSFAGTEKVQIRLSATTNSSSNVQRMTSLGTIGRPASATDANALNITSGAITVTKFSGYGNKTIAAGTTDAKLASFVVGAGAAEGVAVSSITITISSANANSATISRMYLKDSATGAQLGDVKSSISTANLFSVSFNLAASNGKVIDLYGDIKSSANIGSWIATVAADGTGLTTSKAVTGGSTTNGSNAMQTITIGAGSLTTTNGSMPDAAIVLAGSTQNYMAQYTFSATNDGFTIDKLTLLVPSGFATSTSMITVKYKDKAGALQQQSQVLAFNTTDAVATATYTGLTIYVPANSDASIDVYTDLTSISAGATSGAVGNIVLDYNGGGSGFNATGDSGTLQTNTGAAGAGDLTSANFYVRKSKPTFAKLDAGTDPLTKLFRFSVVADNAGNIEIKQLGFNIVTSTAVVTQLYLYDPNSSTQLTTSKANPIWNSSSSADVKLLDGTAQAGNATDNNILNIGTTAKIYEVRGTVTSYGASGSSVTAQFKQDTAAGLTTNAFTAGADGTAAGASAGTYNIWSDRSASAHTTATADWTNGYLLKDMTSAQTFSK